MAVLTPEEIAELKTTKVRLLRAIRSGARDVSHGDKRVSYRTVAEMQSALDGINDELAAAETGKPKKRVIYIGATRGY